MSLSWELLFRDALITGILQWIPKIKRPSFMETFIIIKNDFFHRNK